VGRVSNLPVRNPHAASTHRISGMLRCMYAWRIPCKKPDGSPYFFRYRAADGQVARQLAMSEGHPVDLSVQPEIIPGPIENGRRREPGEICGQISFALALTAIAIPMLAIAGVVVGAIAASESNGRRGWIGLLLSVLVALVWQAVAWSANGRRSYLARRIIA
jgi:hypothetical protein